MMESIFELIIAAGFGAIFGSYATLFAYRLPLGESCFGRYFGKKSRCPRCGTIIKTRDLIPLFNWFFTLGKCRSCSAKIPRTHLFIELATTTLFVICFVKFSFSESFIIYALICVSCVILVVTDYTHKVFPQALLNFLLVIIVVNRVLQDQEIFGMIYSGVIGVIFATFFYQIFYKKCQGFLANQEQSFDYAKFILICAVALSQLEFIFYFFMILANFAVLLIFDAPGKKIKNSFGYILIIPLLLLLLFSPL